MEFAALIHRAMEIRQQYAALEQERYGRSGRVRNWRSALSATWATWSSS
jgi:hypothetical protein